LSAPLVVVIAAGGSSSSQWNAAGSAAVVDGSAAGSAAVVGCNTAGRSSRSRLWCCSKAARYWFMLQVEAATVESELAAGRSSSSLFG
jgi:hypothetical protein